MSHDFENSPDKAIARMAETDELMALLEADAKVAEDKFKAQKAAVFLETQGTDGQKKAVADMAALEMGFLEEKRETIRKFNQLRNERSTLEKRIMLYQTRVSARAKGVVL